METYDVFILTGEYRDTDQGHELVFYGRSEELGPVVMVFDQHKPVFFLDAEEKLPALDFKFERKSLKLETFRGRAVQGIYFDAGADQRFAEDRFKATGVRQFESDVRPPERFLMERFINGMARVAGEPEKDGAITRFHNPKIKASSAPTPELTLVSLDIECGVTEDKLYSIGLHFKGRGKEVKHVLMLAGQQREVNEELTFYPTQRDLLNAFFAWMEEHDPDLIIGWHVVGFDLLYLERKCRDLSLTLDIARDNGKCVLTDKPGAGAYADISGRVVIDGIPAMRGCGFSFPNYKLETVAQSILQAGKLIASDHNKVSEIERQFREDKEALARYNLEDCVLVTQIYEKIDLVSLMIERTRTSGMLLDALGLPTGALDHFILPKLHRKGLVAPATKSDVVPINLSTDSSLEPKPGIYQHVARLNFVNVLPSLVRVFKIDPLARAKSDVNPVMLPSGQRFSSTEHLLPELFEALMAYQAESRKGKNRVAVKACDLTMKQICNALGHKNCRFYEPDILLALSAAESWLVKETVTWLEKEGYEVAFADKEILLVNLREGETETAGPQLAGRLNTFWQNKLMQEFGLSSIEVAYDSHYAMLLVPPVKLKEGAPIRRFAAQKNGELVLEGIESVLNDWTDLARDFSEEMMRQLFADQEAVEPWMRGELERVKSGELDAAMIFRKKIRKDVSEYGKTPPPHIRAARMLEKPGREVRYVFTKRGPEPVDINPGDYDYDHYINKQLEPVADLILGLSEKKLSKLEEPEQMGLF